MSYFRLCLLLGVFVLLFTMSNVSAGADKPLTFSCDDGRRFTITFVKAKGEQFPSTARLIFAKNKTVEILESETVGSGIFYLNGKYGFREHHNDITLTDYTKKGKGGSLLEIPCREVTR